MTMRIGLGTDVHRLAPGRPLVIGGVPIDAEFGAEGHSDADVLFHAITDAVLGALALGDIGTHFPNTDERWRGAASDKFLAYAASLAAEHGFVVANVDSVVEIERPRLRPYIDAMRANIAAVLGVDISRVSVKAKSGEGVDAVGEGRALRAQAVVLLENASGSAGPASPS